MASPAQCSEEKRLYAIKWNVLLQGKPAMTPLTFSHSKNSLSGVIGNNENISHKATTPGTNRLITSTTTTHLSCQAFYTMAVQPACLPHLIEKQLYYKLGWLMNLAACCDENFIKFVYSFVTFSLCIFYSFVSCYNVVYIYRHLSSSAQLIV
jgi:hypothetical protein